MMVAKMETVKKADMKNPRNKGNQGSNENQANLEEKQDVKKEVKMKKKGKSEWSQNLSESRKKTNA